MFQDMFKTERSLDRRSYTEDHFYPLANNITEMFTNQHTTDKEALLKAFIC